MRTFADSPLERFLEFRRRHGRAPRLERTVVQARGLHFAVWSSPPFTTAAPLLCINGGMIYGHDLLWPALAPFAAHRQVILYDQRGRGESAAPPGAGAARIDHDAGDVLAIREAMGITRWDILGHSWGGGIGMLAAERDRVGVRRLVLVDSVGASSGWMPDLHGRGLARLDAARRAELDLLDPEDLQKPDPDNHAAYSRAYYPAWFADPQLSQAFTPPRAASRTGAAIVARLRREGYDWTDLIRAIEARTLVLHGELDPLPSTEARQLSALIPDARLVLIPECGHMPFWEAPETFFLLVESFLTAD